MIYFFIIQGIAILFAFFSARHDSVAVNHFEGYGFLNDYQLRQNIKVFHASNSWMKFFFCCAAALYCLPNWIEAIAVGLITALWIWFLFDIILNLNRIPIRKWHYLGSHDRDGRTWQKLFGKNAGKVKALVLFSAIVGVNVLNIFLW